MIYMPKPWYYHHQILLFSSHFSLAKLPIQAKKIELGLICEPDMLPVLHWPPCLNISPITLLQNVLCWKPWLPLAYPTLPTHPEKHPMHSWSTDSGKYCPLDLCSILTFATCNCVFGIMFCVRHQKPGMARDRLLQVEIWVFTLLLKLVVGPQDGAGVYSEIIPNISKCFSIPVWVINTHFFGRSAFCHVDSNKQERFQSEEHGIETVKCYRRWWISLLTCCLFLLT